MTVSANSFKGRALVVLVAAGLGSAQTAQADYQPGMPPDIDPGTPTYAGSPSPVPPEPGAADPAGSRLQTIYDADSFGAFTPGVARDYETTLGANVISTAGEATLTVRDPAGTGRLVNGAVRAARAAARERLADRRRAARAAELPRPRQQRRRDDRAAAVDRGERAAEDRQVQQGTDPHVVDHDAVTTQEEESE